MFILLAVLEVTTTSTTNMYNQHFTYHHHRVVTGMQQPDQGLGAKGIRGGNQQTGHVQSCPAVHAAVTVEVDGKRPVGTDNNKIIKKQTTIEPTKTNKRKVLDLA